MRDKARHRRTFPFLGQQPLHELNFQEQYLPQNNCDVVAFCSSPHLPLLICGRDPRPGVPLNPGPKPTFVFLKERG